MVFVTESGKQLLCDWMLGNMSPTSALEQQGQLNQLIGSAEQLVHYSALFHLWSQIYRVE